MILSLLTTSRLIWAFRSALPKEFGPHAYCHDRNDMTIRICHLPKFSSLPAAAALFWPAARTLVHTWGSANPHPTPPPAAWCYHCCSSALPARCPGDTPGRHPSNPLPSCPFPQISTIFWPNLVRWAEISNSRMARYLSNGWNSLSEDFTKLERHCGRGRRLKVGFWLHEGTWHRFGHLGLVERKIRDRTCDRRKIARVRCLVGTCQHVIDEIARLSLLPTGGNPEAACLCLIQHCWMDQQWALSSQGLAQI